MIRCGRLPRFDACDGGAKERSRCRCWIQSTVPPINETLVALLGISVGTAAEMAQAKATCQTIVDNNPVAQRLSKALGDYATQLSELAADGVTTSVDDNYDAVAAKVAGFPGVAADKVTAIGAFLKFITRQVLAKSQHDAIIEMLSHETAVDAVGDALVVYVERAYGGVPVIAFGTSKATWKTYVPRQRRRSRLACEFTRSNIRRSRCRSSRGPSRTSGSRSTR